MRPLHQLVGVLAHVQQIYDENSAPSCKYFKYCTKFIRLSRVVLVGTCATYVLCSAIVVMPTLVEYWFTDRIIPCMYVYFVGVTEYSNNVIVLLSLYNYLMLAMMVCHLMAIDLFIYMTFANIPLFALIIEAEIKDLEMALECNSLNAQMIQNKVKNIIDLCHRKYG